MLRYDVVRMRLEAGFGRSPLLHADLWHASTGVEIEIIDQASGVRVGVLDVYEDGDVVYQTEALTLEVHGTTDLRVLPTGGVMFSLPSASFHQVTCLKVPCSGPPTLIEAEEDPLFSERD